MFRLIRSTRAVTTLSPDVESLLRGASRGPDALPGACRAELLAAYDRRGRAPASGLRLVVGEVRWPVAALSAAAAACLVIFAGARNEGRDAASSPGASAALAVVGAGRPSKAENRPSPSTTARERELAFVGGEWEHVHPLPSASARVRVVDDQNLPLIGVGWTPDLDGP